MMNAKSELKDIQFYEEEGRYYLRLKYILEDDHRIEELEIPKVRIPFCKNGYPELIHKSYNFSSPRQKCRLSTGADYVFDLELGETTKADHVYYTRRILKEKHQEMTLAEIEKKLGYKVKIVSEEGKDG